MIKWMWKKSEPGIHLDGLRNNTCTFSA